MKFLSITGGGALCTKLFTKVKTWANGVFVTKTDFNNLKANLANPAWAQLRCNDCDLSESRTSVSFTLSITPKKSGRVFLLCSGNFNPTSAGAWFRLGFYNAAGTELTFTTIQASNSSYNAGFALQYIEPGLTLGTTYTYTIKFTRGNGTGTFHEAGNNESPIFSIIEL